MLEDPLLDLLNEEGPLFMEEEFSSIPSSPSTYSEQLSATTTPDWPTDDGWLAQPPLVEEKSTTKSKSENILPLLEEKSTSSTENVRPVVETKKRGRNKADQGGPPKKMRKNRKYHTEAERLEARKKRNRVSAEKSRQRRIAYTKSLEEKNALLVAKNDRLEAELKELRALVNKLVRPKGKGLGNYSENMSNPLSSSEVREDTA